MFLITSGLGDGDGGDGGDGGGRTPRQDPAPNPITHRDSISRSGSPLTPMLRPHIVRNNFVRNIVRNRCLVN